MVAATFTATMAAVCMSLLKGVLPCSIADDGLLATDNHMLCGCGCGCVTCTNMVQVGVALGNQ